MRYVKIRISIIIILLLIIFGCSHINKHMAAQYDINMEESINKSMNKMTECLRENIRKHDDGISDASTIGMAACSLCRDEIETSALQYAEKLDPKIRERFIREAYDNCSQFSSTIVLQARSKAKK